MKYITVDDAGQITGMYLEAPHEGAIALSDADWERVGPGFRYLEGQLVAPTPQAPTLAELKAALKHAATARRWTVETGGIELAGGARIATAKEDQDRITAVLVNADNAGIETVEFKAANGWMTLPLADLREIAKAVALHVQACFSAERAHHEAIDALTSSSAAVLYDVSTGWPV